MLDSKWLARGLSQFALSLIVWVGAVPASGQPTPAKTGFDNQTNDFEAQGTFLDDKDAFDETEEVFPKSPDVKGGLGPIYNSTSCVACHQNAGYVQKDAAGMFTGSGAVSGTSSQVSEIRAGHT